MADRGERTDSYAALRNDNKKSKSGTRLFFAALRMTVMKKLSLCVEEELAVAHDLFFAVGVA
jgi:hypothetical protein